VYKLPSGFFSGLGRLYKLYGLPFRLLLRNDGSFSCNRDMCDREIFSFFGDLMCELWSRFLPGFDWLFRVLLLYCWFVLRLRRVISRNRRMRSGIVLCSLGIHMLELSSWNVCCDIFNFKLLELSRGDLPSIDWLNSLLSM